jgi:pterin-4a-carbinolamine dehydratase
MLSALKQANKKTIAEILSSSKGTSLESISHLPNGYQMVDSKEGPVLQKTYLYENFKEAFSHFILISKTCHGFNYYPEMFNVYNRIEVRLFSKEGDRRQITSKDYYMALFLD